MEIELLPSKAYNNIINIYKILLLSSY
jgi:hypothetical protein